MPPLTLLIKPASANCNLRCRYCFYEDVSGKRECKSYGLMTQDTLEFLVKKAFEEAEGSVTFIFQGGEPTLAGLDFYRAFVEYIAQCQAERQKKLTVSKVLQTNGMLIDETWARFLAENRFLVGLSLDGPRELHDRCRADAAGEGSFERVMQCAALLKRCRVEYNILCVVTGYTARHAEKIYRFYKNHDFRYLQFIPCLEPLGEARGGYDYSLRPDRYGAFLKAIFDCWYADLRSGHYVSIRQFENYVQMLKGYPPESCGMSGRCSCSFTVEADGSVYPCDFYVLDEWKLGTVFEQSFAQMKSSDRAKAFIRESEVLSPKCRDCKWFALCRGGCRRDRELVGSTGETIHSFCESYSDFFAYTIERLIEIAKRYQKG